VLDQDIQTRSPKSRQVLDESNVEESDDIQPMTRDEILRQLKERRAATQADDVPDPGLGGRFKKVRSEKSSNKKKFVEVVNGRRREVLVITNKDGTTKRKTRWIDAEEDVADKGASQPLGMEVPAEFLARQKAILDQEAADDEDEDDIFQGVTDYDPLAGINSDSEESDSPKDERPKTDATGDKEVSAEDKPRNYFGTSNQAEEGQDRANPISKDPTLLAALKRAAALRRSDEQGGEDEQSVSDPDKAARQQKLLARLKEQDRVDAADMDPSFGDSRFGDEDDDEGPIWEGDEDEGSTKKSARKRRPKKRKGDKDNVNDVMAVLGSRRKEK
jgi:hypothetical protein